jgi:hypothetical protein
MQSKQKRGTTKLISNVKRAMNDPGVLLKFKISCLSNTHNLQEADPCPYHISEWE